MPLGDNAKVLALSEIEFPLSIETDIDIPSIV